MVLNGINFPLLVSVVSGSAQMPLPRLGCFLCVSCSAVCVTKHFRPKTKKENIYFFVEDGLIRPCSERINIKVSLTAFLRSFIP